MSSRNSLTIDANADIEQIRDRIGVGENEKLRSSSRRENYLQKFSRVMTGEQLNLLLHPDRADTSYKEDPPRIRIPMRKPPQSVTNHPDKIYEMMFQETITLHEIGHVMYTDFDEFHRAGEGVEQGYQALFKDIVNCLEDGAIEAQLRGEYNVNDELLTLHSNLVEDSTYGTQISEDRTIYTFHEATTTALLDMCVYNSNRLAALLDESNEKHRFAKEEDGDLFRDNLDEIKGIASDVMSEPNGTQRMLKMENFFLNTYKDLVNQAEVGGVSQANNKEKQEAIEGKPDDFSSGQAPPNGGSGGSTQPADSLPDSDEILEALENDSEEDDDEEAAGGGGSDDEDEDDADAPGSYAGALEEGEESREEVKESIKDEYKSEVKREAEAEAGGMMDEIEQLHEMMKGASDGDLKSLEIEVPQSEEGIRERWEETRRRARMLSQTFERRLQRESRSRTKRNQRRGKFDTSSISRASRGNPRVFKRSGREEVKDYSCLIVQDRSGSMSGAPTAAAEKGVGALAKALLDVGVDVSVIDLHSYTPRLTLPFGTDIEDRVDVMFSDETGGGTPLTEVIQLARERLELEAEKFPFMIVVTDDAPSKPSEYKDELDKCNFPVIGVSVNIDGGCSGQVDASNYFHRQVTVESEDELYRKLQKLAEEVLF